MFRGDSIIMRENERAIRKNEVFITSRLMFELFSKPDDIFLGRMQSQNSII